MKTDKADARDGALRMAADFLARQVSYPPADPRYRMQAEVLQAIHRALQPETKPEGVTQ